MYVILQGNNCIFLRIHSFGYNLTPKKPQGCGFWKFDPSWHSHGVFPQSKIYRRGFTVKTRSISRKTRGQKSPIKMKKSVRIWKAQALASVANSMQIFQAQMLTHLVKPPRVFKSFFLAYLILYWTKVHFMFSNRSLRPLVSKTLYNNQNYAHRHETKSAWIFHLFRSADGLVCTVFKVLTQITFNTECNLLLQINCEFYLGYRAWYTIIFGEVFSDYFQQNTQLNKNNLTVHHTV